MLNKAGPTKQQLFAIYHLMMNQHRITYRLKELLIGFAKCFCLREKHALLKAGKNDPHARTEFYKRQGMRKLERDLDIVSLIDMVKGYRVMRQVLFDKNQLNFLKY